MTKSKKIILGLITIALATLLCYFLFFKDGKKDNNSVAFVDTVERITSSSHSINDRFSGVVEAQKTVDITKNNEQKIEEIYVKVGEQVKKDTKLFKYDVTEAQKEIDTTNLDIEESNSTIKAKYAEIKDLETQLQSASEDMKLEIQSAISQANNSIRQAEYDIQYKKLAIADKQKQIDNAVVVAPEEGIVKAINENQVGQNGETLPYIQISKSGDFIVKASVDENSVQMITVGQPMLMISRKDENNKWTGKISEIKLEPETNNQNGYFGKGDSSVQSRSKYPVYIALDDSKGLMLGQHVFVQVSNDNEVVREGLWLDGSYLVFEDGKVFVWASENGKLKKKEIEIGESNIDFNQYQIKSGLELTDEIAWPMENYKEGMPTQSQNQ